MSRTIRRTKARKTRCRFEKDYTHHIPQEWDGRDTGIRGNRCGKDFPLLPLEGKAFKIAYWKYHSDNGCVGFAFENFFEYPMSETNREQRARFKLELGRWIKNPDHELIFQKSKQIWDYC